MERIPVLIVGAGMIAASADAPGAAVVLTHGHAFSALPDFRLVGFVDPDGERAERAARAWGGEPFRTLEEAFSRTGVEVVVAAAPDEAHRPVLEAIAEHPVRLVLAEKPLTTRLADSEAILDLYRRRGIRLGVNYSRRYVPEFRALRDRIASGALGSFAAGVGHYGKGLLHNGSHMVDLLRFLIGEVSEARGTSSLVDHRPEDPSCSALLTFAQGGTFFMQAIDCRHYTVFELDLLFERGRVRLLSSGMELEAYEVRDSPLFAGFRNIERVATSRTSLDHACLHAARSVHAALAAGAPLPCDGADGLAAQRICSSIRETLP